MRSARLAGGIAACVFAAGAVAAQDMPRIVAVNHPLQYFTERLIGEAAEVVFPVPEGIDPSFWRPGIADISAVQSADLIVLNGAGFATWTAKVSLPRSKLVDTSRGLQERFIAAQSITHSHGEGGAHSHDGTASYTWLDLTMAAAQAQAIAEALDARGLVAPDVVEVRMAALAEELRATDEAARDALADAGDTVFIATHPRYQYLARAYDLTILSVEWDAGAMPDADQLAELQALTEQSGASVLIWEARPPEAALEAVAALGLQSSVFPPLAAPAERGFTESFGASVSELRQAVRRARTE